MQNLTIKILLCILTFLCTSPYVSGQVTIGSGNTPAQGALLQLKENENTGTNSTKGLAMPRVSLTVTDELTDIIPSPTSSDKEEHIGLVVYNINDLKYNFCHGLYVWAGLEWQPLSEQPPVPLQRAYGSVSDIDGNVYKTLTFGTAGTWMVENLRVLHDNTGGVLAGETNARINPALTNGVANSALSVGSLADINALPSIAYSENGVQVSSTAADYVKKFGLMYTTAQRANLCPAGWHIPSQVEWLALAQYFVPGTGIGSNDNAQMYFQSGYTEYVSADGSSNTWQGFICNNAQMSGFNALPAGRIYLISPVNSGQAFGMIADFATSQALGSIAIYNRYPPNNGISFATGNSWATPVRCKKD